MLQMLYANCTCARSPLRGDLVGRGCGVQAAQKDIASCTMHHACGDHEDHHLLGTSTSLKSIRLGVFWTMSISGHYLQAYQNFISSIPNYDHFDHHVGSWDHANSGRDMPECPRSMSQNGFRTPWALLEVIYDNFRSSTLTNDDGTHFGNYFIIHLIGQNWTNDKWLHGASFIHDGQLPPECS